MDDFTSAFLNKGREELRDVETNVNYTPFGVTSTGNDSRATILPEHLSMCMAPTNAEPESITQWRKEFDAGIETRDSNESKKVAQLNDAAKKEMQDWDGWYRNVTIKARQENKMHEEELKAMRDKSSLISASVSQLDPGDAAIWERVCQLCDLTVSASGDPQVSSTSLNRIQTQVSVSTPPKDTTRFRSLLLSLRKNPPKVQRQ